MALTALYNLSFTPGMETGNEEKGALDDKDQLVPGMYIFRYCVGIINKYFLFLILFQKLHNMIVTIGFGYYKRSLSIIVWCI